MITPTYLGDRAYTFRSATGEEVTERTLYEALILAHDDGFCGDGRGNDVVRTSGGVERHVARWDENLQCMVAGENPTDEEVSYMVARR